jgi:hypothetical protein
MSEVGNIYKNGYFQLSVSSTSLYSFEVTTTSRHADVLLYSSEQSRSPEQSVAVSVG